MVGKGSQRSTPSSRLVRASRRAIERSRVAPLILSAALGSVAFALPPTAAAAGGIPDPACPSAGYCPVSPLVSTGLLRYDLHADIEGGPSLPSGGCGTHEPVIEELVRPPGPSAGVSDLISESISVAAHGGTAGATANATDDVELADNGALRRFTTTGAAATESTGMTVLDPDVECGIASHRSAGVSYELRFNVPEASGYSLDGGEAGDPSTSVRLCRMPTGLVYTECAASELQMQVGEGLEYGRAGTLSPGSYRLMFRAAAYGCDGCTGFHLRDTDWDIDVRIGPRATWDWSVPARYGLDEDADRKVDSFAPDSLGGDNGPEIAPALWPVELVAAPCVGNDDTARRWVVEGDVVGHDDRAVLDGDPTGCDLTYGFASEGDYAVALEELDPATGAVLATNEQTVTVEDTLIVSLGDSLASGEGAPEIQGNAPGQWQDRQCHRSAAAGPAQAARALEEADDRTTVTFVHLACSGAKVTAGLDGYYPGIEPNGTLLVPQVDQLGTLTEGREIDAVTVSIGANDVGFATIVQKCFDESNCDASVAGTARTLAESKLTHLPGLYDRVAVALGSEGVSPKRVFLTEYPDPMRGDRGLCENVIKDYGPAAALNPLSQITAREAKWASNRLVPALNAAGEQAARRYGWNHVGGMAQSFGGHVAAGALLQPHGYCARDRWITTLTQSFAQQGDKNGTLHPNIEGHRLGYASPLVTALDRVLHPEPAPSE